MIFNSRTARGVRPFDYDTFKGDRFRGHMAARFLDFLMTVNFFASPRCFPLVSLHFFTLLMPDLTTKCFLHPWCSLESLAWCRPSTQLPGTSHLPYVLPQWALQTIFIRQHYLRSRIMVVWTSCVDSSSMWKSRLPRLLIHNDPLSPRHNLAA